MTPLRQRMLVSRFARHFGRSLAVLGPEEIRAYQVYLATDKQLAPASIGIAVAALRFLYTVTLQKRWAVAVVIPMPKVPDTFPVVLSPGRPVSRQCLAPQPSHDPDDVLRRRFAALRSGATHALRDR